MTTLNYNINKIFDENFIKSIFSCELTDKDIDKLTYFFNTLFITPNKYKINYIKLRILKFKYAHKICNKLTVKTNNVIIFLDALKFWCLFSNKVLRGEYLNFPLLYDYKIKYELERVCCNFEYFENKQILDYSQCKCENIEMYNQIKFQELAIMYTLFLHGISTPEPIFDYIMIPKTKITYKIKSLLFTFDTNYIVILNYQTILNYYINFEETYINSVDLSGNYFLETFIKNFICFFNCNNYLIPGNIQLNLERKDLNNVKPGNMCICEFRNGYYYGIILEVNEDTSNIMLIVFNNLIKKTVFINQIIENDNLYEEKNLINNDLICHDILIKIE